MARTNPPLLSFNRGLLSPKALARVDLDRVRLSAEVYENWLPSTAGSMSIRPGTKYFGSSLNDSGAAWIEFVASTDDVALLELTHNKMRIWMDDDAHTLALLGRPKVDTTVTISDTGWSNTSTGGAVSTAATDLLPTMTGPTTNGVTITASSENTSVSNGGDAYFAADDANFTHWHDTGPFEGGTLPSWWNVNFGSDTGNRKAVRSYTIRGPNTSAFLDNAPKHWRLITGNFDTGTYATDTGKWTLVDERSNQVDWSIAEKRTYTRTDADTGTVEIQRHWRFYFTEVDTGSGDVSRELLVGEIELFDASTAQQVKLQGGKRIFNASSIGARARAEKRVLISDTGTEHSLAITVDRGPVTLRVGSTQRDDDYISEATLGTGYHNLAFTPTTNFWITLQSDAIVDRTVGSLAIGDSGTVEITTPWASANLDNIRYDQSADVVDVDCEDVRPQKIERRGTGRSWSVVDYAPDNGPFLSTRSSSAKLSVSHFFGNTTLNSDIPFFTSDHVGALVRIFHEGQGGQWRLGALDAVTDAIQVTGISDTGTTPPDDTGYSDRSITFSASGTWSGRITFEKSDQGPESGFKTISGNVNFGGVTSDTGTFFHKLVDRDDNLKVWYRARLSSYTSGVPVVRIQYAYGGVTGIGRITGFSSNTAVSIEVLSRFSDTGQSDNWQQGYWSGARGFPTAVALHGGRLAHAQGGSLFLSVSDDYENFDDTTTGDAGPIIRTLGSGPVDSIHALISLLRLIIHTAGAELALRSSSLDEPVTPTNSSAGTFSTNGSASLRAVKMDNRGIFVQRSEQRLFMVGAGAQSAFGDYEAFELTLLVPDLLEAGVVSLAIQRQPDTRIHCVLGDGTVAILTYEPQEEVVCWTTWSSDTGSAVEKAMILPGVSEDAVYYHIRRMVGSGNDVYTKILLHLDGLDGATSFNDTNVGGSSHSWTPAGNAQVDTTQAKFGGASLLCDGTGDYIDTSDHADFALGASDFTIDTWFNVNAAGGTELRLCGQSDAGLTAAGSSFYIRRSTGNVIVAGVSNGSAFTDVTGTTQFTTAVNTGWHHVAFVRTGSTLKLFVDGTQEGGDVTFTGTAPNSTGKFSVGGRGGAGSLLPWNGWIDEFRLSVGIARWTSNFTAPTAPYGSVRRFLEKWAKESECQGDTGLHWLADCAASITDTGRTTSLNAIVPHLPDERVIVWGSLDTGTTPHVDLSPDTGSDFEQRLWTADTGGDITLTGLTDGVHHAVAGLRFPQPTWVSSKLAYGAQMGSALAQQKRVPQAALVLYKTHARGLFLGTDTGTVDPLPRVIEGATVDQDHIFPVLDKVAFPVPGTWKTDPRTVIKGKAPRPATVLAAIPTVVTSER